MSIGQEDKRDIIMVSWDGTEKRYPWCAAWHALGEPAPPHIMKTALNIRGHYIGLFYDPPKRKHG